MNGLRHPLLAIAVLLVGGIVAACSAGATPTPVPSATPGVARVDVTGTMQCAGDPAAVSCQLKMSDPRASGTAKYGLTVKQMPDGSLSESAQFSLNSAGGTWDCKTAGSQSPNAVLTADAVCTGQSAFAPFLMYIHLISRDAGGNWSATGSIEAA